MRSRAILEAAFERVAGEFKEYLTKAMGDQAELFAEAIGKVISEAAPCPACATSIKAALNRALNEIAQKA